LYFFGYLRYLSTILVNYQTRSKMKNNSNNPEILRNAILGLMGAMSAYYEDEIDMPYHRTKSLAQKVNDMYNLNIDVDVIFIEPKIEDDEGCGHDQNEAYYL
jgi:hypothetical protein